MRPTLWAASLRHLAHRPAQLALALLGLALGVATICAVDIATASASRAFELSMSAVSGPATDEITAGPGGIDEGLYVRIATRESALAPVPLVEGYVTVGDEALQLIGIDPLAAANGGFGAADDGTGGAGAARASGTAPAAQLGETAVDGLEGLRRWLTEPGAVVMAGSTAERLGLSVGQHFEIEVDGRRRSAVLLRRDASVPGSEALLLTDVAQAQEWLGSVGRLSRIELRAPPGPAGAAALERLRAELPRGIELQPIERRSQASLDMTRAFAANLHAMSLLALLVGLFLIYGAVSFAVLQRRRTFAVLRALGATQLDVVRLVVGEAVALGAAGTLVGVLVGVALGRGLVALVSRTVNDLYFVVAVNSVALPRGELAEAIAAGLATALVAALLPAAEVARITPQLGLQRSSVEARARGIAQALLLASAALALGSGIIVLLSARSLLAGFAALFLLLLSVAAAAPALLAAAARAASRLAGASSPIGRLAFQGVEGSLSRTGVAVASLGLAIAAMIGVSVMVGSFRASLRDWLARTMREDVYVAAPGPGFGRPERKLDPGVLAAVTSLPGVEAFGASRQIVVDSSRGPINVDAVSFAPQSYAGVELVAGGGLAGRGLAGRAATARIWKAFAQGAILVAEPLAWRLGMRPGDSLTLVTSAGPRRFEVAGIFREYGNERGGVLMDRSVYRRGWGDDAVSALGLYLAPGVTPARIIPALRAAAAGRQALLVTSSADVRALSMDIFERTFVITRVLYWLAAGVAAIGLTSSLLAWELERSHETAIMRALGLTPRGAAALIETQTLFMGLAAFAAAVPAGLLAAELLVTVVNRRAFGWVIEFHLQGAQLVNALWLALAAAAAAGLYPAWRTARASVATHLREE